MIALGVGGGLTAFNYLFGQSLDASKYVTSAMLFVYTVVIIGMVWSIRFKTISPHNYAKILRFFWLVVGLVVGLAAVEMAQIILSGGSSLMEVISKYLIYSNSYVLNFIKFGGKTYHCALFRTGILRSGVNLNLAQYQTVWYQNT